MSQGVDSHLLVGRKRAQAAADTINFCLADGFEMVLQGDNGRDHVERVDAGLEAIDFAVDDGFGASASLLRSATWEVTACCRSSMS